MGTGLSNPLEDAPDQRLGPAQIDLIAGRLEGLPALAPAPRAWEESAPPAAMLEAAACDPAIAAAVLRAANQATGREVCTVTQAAEDLGVRAIRSIALAALARPTPGADALAEAGWDPRAFWRHCLGAAFAAKGLAEKTRLAEPEEAWLWGLLHDVGVLGLLQVMPKSYARVLRQAGARGGALAEHEFSILGVDHALFGKHLAQQWRLPQALQEVIWLHHQGPDSPAISPSAAPRVRLVQLANALARAAGLGAPSAPSGAVPAEDIARRLGIDVGLIDSVRGRLADEVDALRRRLGAEEEGPSGGARRRGDVDRRVSELARLNQGLAQEARSLSAQAAAFEHLGRFARELRPDAALGDVLEGIARLVCEALEIAPSVRSPVVAYAAGLEEEPVLTARLAGEGRPEHRALRPNPQVPRGDAPPSSAADALSRLLLDTADVGEWLDPAACRHRAWVCAGRWVGGILYPTPARPDAEDILAPLADSLALWLAMAMERRRAAHLSERLADALPRLTAAQDALANARTLAAVGEMAAGAAHEINNPLAVISGRAQLMLEKAPDEAQRKVWRLIVEQAQRISDIITDVMQYARPPAPKPEAVGAADLLKEALAAFAGPQHRDALPPSGTSPQGGAPQAAAPAADIEVADGLPPVLADRSQMRDVLVELIRNATAAGAGSIRLAAHEDPAGVLLSVRDDGPGMDAPTQAAALTPFFSRQPAGRRRGLGLPRARRYVEVNGGSLWLTSQPGQGTTVFLRLPAAR